eukprot:CAMPEP_0183795616 /NCGR_PEP_ID=MMETSP0803_2-20130417/4857_1 /TAXON_ID=195967 /ORGANISM="Crustomastix stigmata, Strain CCMP3273" /LENGTH=183 /DNA_ID=CAMNT_0026040063 /DNA_START=60 /DNA_END=611 /DNA_ORIENTATION=+
MAVAARGLRVGTAAGARRSNSRGSRCVAPAVVCAPSWVGDLRAGAVEFASGVAGALDAATNGATVFMMRHGMRKAKLNKPADQRKAMLRALTTQLLQHGRIETTKARAKALRKHVDAIITFAKDGSDHSKIQAKRWVYDAELVDAVFEEVPERYGDRNGGYTRIMRTMPRRGDNAEMAVIELV